MPIYEIINPSDRYTIEGELPVAAIAVTMLGVGHYSLKDKDGEAVFPFFMFGGAEAMDDWFKEHGGKTTQEYAESIPDAELAKCFESVVSGNFADREFYFRTLATIPCEKREEWTREYHDRKRSSLNDIGARAKAYAKALMTRGAQDKEGRG